MKERDLPTPTLRTCLGALATCLAIQPVWGADLITFWDRPQSGGNSFNAAPPHQAYFDALAGTGARWVRLTFSKWKGQDRDFLIGDADAYAGLVPEDLALLRQILDRAERAGLKVVIAPLSLPGRRWSQQNGGSYDDRLWQDMAFQDQAAEFWADLAKALKDHPAVAAYNILNEPAPEKASDLAESAPLAARRDWQATQAGARATWPVSMPGSPTESGRRIRSRRSWSMAAGMPARCRWRPGPHGWRMTVCCMPFTCMNPMPRPAPPT